MERLDVAPVWSGHPVGFSIATADNRQYVAFYDSERRMTVAGRDLGSTDWTYQRLRSRLGWDSHNGVVVAADSAGFIHIAGNMHGDPLVYLRSQRPHDLSTLEREQMIGTRELQVSYPQFVLDSNGALFFHYRDGRSGEGVRIFNRWDPSSRRWSRYLDQPLFDGLGRASAYLNGPLPGPDGAFHLVWVWRDTPSGATNHDISYARSTDLAHWETAGGEPLELPLTPAHTAAVVDPVAAGSGLAGIAFHVGWDGAGRPVVNYVKYDPAGVSQLHNARWEGDVWRVYRTSDWSWRWELDVTGSLEHLIVTEAVRVDPGGRLLQRFRHHESGSGEWVLDAASLRPVDTLPLPGVLGELRRPESATPGMEVRGFVWDRRGEYLLRWETLPHNRDRRRKGPAPAPTMLRVLRLGEARPD
ncbi:MAG: BNR repeat-containing protein [Thermoanaerobaculia bacterium]